MAIISAFKLYVLLNDIGVVKHINIQCLSWLGNILQIDEDAPTKRVYDVGKEDDVVRVERSKYRNS